MRSRSSESNKVPASGPEPFAEQFEFHRLSWCRRRRLEDVDAVGQRIVVGKCAAAGRLVATSVSPAPPVSRRSCRARSGSRCDGPSGFRRRRRSSRGTSSSSAFLPQAGERTFRQVVPEDGAAGSSTIASAGAGPRQLGDERGEGGRAGAPAADGPRCRPKCRCRSAAGSSRS